ncbi:MAG: ComEA family DNA-binding protein [Planctomycetota bacterium]|jgi:competence protein ComEA
MPRIISTESDRKFKTTQSFALVIASVLALLLCTLFLFSNFTKSVLSHQIVLENKIDPNYAPVSSLSRLPGIGIGRANAIIAYRKKLKKISPHTLPFIEAGDLQKIKGIGPKTVGNIRPFLKFQSHRTR